MTTWTNAFPWRITFATRDGVVHTFDARETRDLPVTYDAEIHVVRDGVLVGGVLELLREPEELYRRQAYARVGGQP